MDCHTLPSLLEEVLLHRLDKVLAVSADGHPLLTYREAANRIEAAAVGLHALGVRPKDRVVLCLKRGTEEFIAAWAVMRLGAIFVSVPERAAPTQIAYLIADADPAVVVAADPLAARIRALGIKVRLVEWDQLPANGSLPNGLSLPGGGDLAALAYTSGSTGLPKGVMVSHRNFIEATKRVSGYLGNRETDRISALLPLSAPWGVLQWTSMLLAGGSVALPPATRFASEIALSVRRAGVTGLAALSVTWTQLVNWAADSGETLPGLRYITSSGGAITRRVLEAMPVVFPGAQVFLTYGLAEAFRTTLVPPEWLIRKMGSLGRPCPGVDIVVVGEDGEAVRPGERGELVHRGGCVALGYWRRSGEGMSAFRPCAGGDPSKASLPAHFSGDIVEQDADGFLWFVGRRDTMIKTAGYRVSPTEIELAAEASGFVRQAIAWGEPDKDLGQSIVLAVESLGPQCTVAALARYFRSTFPSHLQPQRIVIWPDRMPSTLHGKVDRAAVARRSEL